MSHDLNRDPQEDDPKLKAIFEAAEKEAEEVAGKILPRGTLGFCHAFWPAKQRILKEKYGIDWKTPIEQNPGVTFD